MKKTVFVLLICISSLSGLAQQFNGKKLDSLFQKLDEHQKWMGSFAISVNGFPVYTTAIGFSDSEGLKKSTTSSKYRIGSISKTFTAVLIFKAIEAKKLSLNDKLANYFPTVKNADKITISDLLNHRSGIYNFIISPDYKTYYTTKKSTAEIVTKISALPSDFEPGTKFSYGNASYVLLGYILEKVYKKPLNDILNEEIVKPLSLKNTYLGDQINPSQNEVYSYTFLGTWMKIPSTDMSIPAGAGAVVSNPNDLTVFINALFNGKLVSKQSLTLMCTLKDGYGYGLFEFPFNDKKGIGHNGSIDGFSSMLFYFPADKLSFALVSNGNSYENHKIARAALSEFYKIPYEIPSFNKISLTSEDLDQYLGEYASPAFPLKIIVSKKGNVLFTQATGQSEFPVEPIGKNIFEYQAAGIVLEFKPAEKQMILKQGAGKYVLIKP